MLRGHVFSKQLFANECFALFIDTFLDNQNGIINGCVATSTAEAVTLPEGYFCIQGRFCQEVGGSTFNVSASDTTLYQQLVCEIDLSKVNTVTQLNQAYYKVLSSDTDYQELIQQDITIPTQIYQFEFARWEVGSNGITNFNFTGEMLDFDSIYAEVRTKFNGIMADIEAERVTFFENLNTEAEQDYTDYKLALENLETQFESYISGLKNDAETTLNQALQDLEEDVNTWFNTIKGQISGDLGVSLQLQINDLDDNKVDNTTFNTTISNLEDEIDEVRQEATKAIDFKGQVQTYANLPANAEEGDLYQVLTADSTHNINAGDFVVWEITSGTGAWLNLGSFVDTNAFIDLALTITLDVDDWIQNENGLYEQTIQMQGMTSSIFIDCTLDFENQEILGASLPESFTDYWKIYAKELPESDVVMNVIFGRTRGGSL